MFISVEGRYPRHSRFCIHKSQLLTIVVLGKLVVVVVVCTADSTLTLQTNTVTSPPASTKSADHVTISSDDAVCAAVIGSAINVPETTRKCERQQRMLSFSAFESVKSGHFN